MNLTDPVGRDASTKRAASCGHDASRPATTMVVLVEDGVMKLDRPILKEWRATPWVTATPVDERTIGAILDEEVQIGFRGDGPMSSRELVPLSAGATELLNGTHRDGARRVIRGMLATLDGREGEATLRGMSMSSDQASFATNLLVSNTEAGFYPDSVGAGDAAGLERSMVSLVPSVRAAKAQNTGWLDFGPRVSEKLRRVIEQSTSDGRYTAGRAEARSAPGIDADATEVALTMLHELQHSVTPHDPNEIEDRHVWLEEGIAETLAWWPGRAVALRERMGVPARAGEVIDPFSVPPDSVASTEYRNRHRAVQVLLGLAGIRPTSEDGRPDRHALSQAERILQGGPLDRVSNELARAIVHRHGLDDQLVPTVAELIESVDGEPAAVDALAGAMRIGAVDQAAVW